MARFQPFAFKDLQQFDMHFAFFCGGIEVVKRDKVEFIGSRTFIPLCVVVVVVVAPVDDH